jgi:ApbE superfamily uncharacterized protein (UPF0280 family)
MAAQRTRLDGGRWHFAHGPIELVIGAQGDAASVTAAHEAAWQRFQPLLAELVAELPRLRRPVRAGANPLRGAVARRMWQACAAIPTQFITSMAAVAGAVAEEVAVAYAAPGITRAFVNNGGDIALVLQPQAEWRVGLVADIARKRPARESALEGRFTVRGTDPVRGIATSGWRGRSQSLGIADAVTVLAATAAQADAAATIIANAVDVDDARIVRAPGCTLRDDSDLGERLVTIGVPPLSASQLDHALRSGASMARDLQAAGSIHAAALVCQGRQAFVQPLGAAEPLAA